MNKKHENKAGKKSQLSVIQLSPYQFCSDMQPLKGIDYAKYSIEMWRFDLHERTSEQNKSTWKCL